MNIEDIKARAEAVSAHEYNGVDDYLYAKDVKALIAKVERLTKAVKQGGINYQQKCRDIAELEAENATLKNALELACNSKFRYMPNPDYFIQQVQKQEAEK